MYHVCLPKPVLGVFATFLWWKKSIIDFVSATRRIWPSKIRSKIPVNSCSGSCLFTGTSKNPLKFRTKVQWDLNTPNKFLASQDSYLRGNAIHKCLVEFSMCGVGDVLTVSRQGHVRTHHGLMSWQCGCSLIDATSLKRTKDDENTSNCDKMDAWGSFCP